MPTLREFIENREKEIREQMKLLRQELKELKAVKATLEQTSARKGVRKKLTIKEKIMDVLHDMKQGTANQILKAIEDRFGEKLERSSLSPQLSRLRQEGRLDFRNGLWFISGRESVSDSESETDANHGDGVGFLRGGGFPSASPEGSIPSNSTVRHQAESKIDPFDLDALQIPDDFDNEL